MLVKLILLMTLIPALELILLIRTHSWLATQVGTGQALLLTLGLIFGTGVIGAHLARSQGFAVVRRFQSASQKGVLPTQEILDGVMILVGGFLLLAPGLLTDIFGLTLLVPTTRSLYRAALSRALSKALATGAIDFRVHGFSEPKRQSPESSGEVIDVEYIEPENPGNHRT